LLRSDSLRATVIAIVLVLTISANGELELPEVDEEDEPELPRPPAVVPPVPPVEELDDDPVVDVEDAAALEVDPAVTELPGTRLESDTIVPLIGAYSLVFASAVLAVLTLAWALYTAACAEAIVAAGEVELVELPEPVEPPPLEPLAPEPLAAEPPPAGDAVAELLGVVAAGAVVVGLVVVVVVWELGVVVVVGVDFEAAALGTVVVLDTNWAVPVPELVLRLAVVVVELVVDVELASAVLSWSWAAVRLCSAWLSESCAPVESSVASSWPLVTCCPVLT
jgi:hypothetical protein